MSLVWRLWLALGLAVVLTTVGVSAVLLRWLEARTLVERSGDLRQAAFLIEDTSREALAGRPGAAEQLQARMTRLAGRGLTTRLTVIGLGGEVLADSRQDPGEMDDHSERPEIEVARDQGEGSAIRYSATLETRLIYYALRVADARGHSLGYVRASMPLATLDQRATEVRQVAALAGVAGVLLILGAGYLATRRVTKPLESVTEAARAVAEGQEIPTLPEGGGDELGTLAQAFNRMGRQLRERVATIDGDRRKLSAIIDSMADGLIAADGAGRILHINGLAADLLDTDAQSAVGLRIDDVTRQRVFGDVITRTLEGLASATEELEIDALPSRRHLVLRGTPLWTPDQAPAGALLVIHDVTELRRLESVRRDFVANVSHELKTPLTALLAQLETLLDHPEMEDSQRIRFLDKSRQQGERLASLVSDLLALSRIESTDTSAEFRAVDLRSVARASADGLTERAAAKGIALALELAPQPVEILGDAEYLRQVADNLLSNAIMYSPAGASVALRVERRAGRAALEVSDAGIGIPSGEQERIFERFYRVDRARSRDLGGTGLGLAIVKHLVRGHRGTVSVQSEVDQGSTFTALFPLLLPGRSEAPGADAERD